MNRGTFLKFLYLSYSNLKRFVAVNLLLLIPCALIVYSLTVLLPAGFRYINSFSITVRDVSPQYGKLAVVLVSDAQGVHRVYVFERSRFNAVRRYIFQSTTDEHTRSLLKEQSIGSREVPAFKNTVSLTDRSGQHLMDLSFEGSRENVVEVLFINAGKSSREDNIVLFAVLFGIGFILFAGSIGGVCDYTQRIVFHEIRGFRYLFLSLRKYFFRSLFTSFFFTVVIGAIATNIYFYIFIITSDISVFIAAINFWMLVFFVFILFWVYPLMILSGEETVWRVMRKSLFISFDNFQYTLDAVVFAFLMMIASSMMGTLVPGPAGIFSFLNSALKEISYRYTDGESA